MEGEEERERAGSIDRFLIVTLNDQIQAGWTDPYDDQTQQFHISFLPSFPPF